MSDYGLVVYNDNGGLMFDSSRKMNSYVVTEIGTGTAPSSTLANDDYLFVSIPSGQADYMSQFVIFRQLVSNKFYGYNISTGANATLLTLDYFVIKHASKVTSNENYGLVVYNEDSTIQFDSRAITLGQHFRITSFTGYREADAFQPSTGGTSLGSLTDYWELNQWTIGAGIFGSGSGFQGEDKSVTGIRFIGNGPRAYSYFQVGGDEGSDGFGGDGGGEGFGGNGFGGTTTSEEIYASTINRIILSAELV